MWPRCAKKYVCFAQLKWVTLCPNQCSGIHSSFISIEFKFSCHSSAFQMYFPAIIQNNFIRIFIASFLASIVWWATPGNRCDYAAQMVSWIDTIKSTLYCYTVDHMKYIYICTWFHFALFSFGFNKSCWWIYIDLFAYILQGYFTSTGAIAWLPQCQWSNPEGYG